MTSDLLTGVVVVPVKGLGRREHGGAWPTLVGKMTDLRSHEPPRNSGEVAAVHGPTTLGEKDDANEPD